MNSFVNVAKKNISLLKNGKYCVLFGLTHSASTLSHGVSDCYGQCSAKYEQKHSKNNINYYL